MDSYKIYHKIVEPNLPINASPPPVNKSRNPLFIIIGIFVFIIIIISLVFALIFLKIIKIPKIGAPAKIGTGKLTSTATSQKFLCPFNKTPCGGEVLPVLSKAPNLSGLGYPQQASGTAVLSIISGKLHLGNGGQKNNPETALIVTSKQNNISVIYTFQGTPSPDISSGADITKGQTIGFMGEGEIGQEAFDKTYGLILLIQNIKTQKYSQITPISSGLSANLE